MSTTSINTKTNFPSETIELPSKGLFYSKDSPLSSGTIELKYPTAREEDILTSQNLIKKNIVIERFLQSLIITKDVNYSDLLVGDVNAIMVAARILAYGDNYPAEVQCPSCDKKQQIDINLNDLNNNPFEPKDFKDGLFTFELPISKTVVEIGLLTQGDLNNIDKELKQIKKISGGVEHEMSTRLKYMIKSIDGDSTSATIRTFVDESLLSRDAFELRKYLTIISPDIDMTFDFSCEDCEYEGETMMPIGIGFFWPSTGK